MKSSTMMFVSWDKEKEKSWQTRKQLEALGAELFGLVREMKIVGFHINSQTIGRIRNLSLPKNLIFSLHEKGFFFLHQVAYLNMTSIWIQEWKSEEMMRLEDDLV